MKRYPFGKFILDIPDDHRIIEIHRSSVLYDRAYGPTVEAISKAAPSAVFIDIGANIGDTAAFMATHGSNPILCVEGGSVFADYLRANLRHLREGVRLVEKFVRPKALEMLALGFNQGTGTGSLSSHEAQFAVEADNFIDTLALLDEARKINDDLALIKNDTDGFDGYIVADLLRFTDTPLFFECDTNTVLPELPSPWPGVFEQLETSVTASSYLIITACLC